MTKKPYILLVDDNEENLNILEGKLYPLDCELQFARDGLEAIDMVNQRNPDLILLDIMMPKMNGFDVARTLKSREQTMIIPIVIITSLDGTQERVQAIEAGADDFLTKPVNTLELRARVKSLLRVKDYYDKMHNYQKKLKKMNDQLEAAVIKANEMTAKAEATSQRLQEEKEKVSVYALEMEELAKERARQLVHADRMVSLGVLSAGIAHEINNPTTFIKVSAATLEKWWKMLIPIVDKALESEWDKTLGIPKLDRLKTQLPDIIESITTGTSVISNITHALRRFARADHAEKKTINIREAIDTAILMTKNKYHYYAGLEVIDNLEHTEIYGNSRQMEQVFINLIVNAADAIKEKQEKLTAEKKDFKGEIKISFHLPEHKNNFLEIRIHDNGIGMDETVREKLFDPFFTTKPQDKGTGLGMSITYGIIKEHDGSILVESKKNEGTCFTILLPRTKQA